MIIFAVVVSLLFHTFCTSLPFSTYGRDGPCDELVLLNVIHRHGYRARDAATYPNDPYINETFFPYGLGQLTNKGKLRMYNVGVDLKQRYRCFLGDLYFPDLIEARSTDVNRTKASLALSSAGLFPPKGPLIWSLLNWIPIPYNYEKIENDFVLGSKFSNCPKYVQLYGEHLNGPGAELYSDDIPFYKYLTENSGMNVTDPSQIYGLYFALKTEEEWGLSIPRWAKPYLDTELKKGTIKQYKLQTGTTELKKLAAGFYIKKILEDSLRKISNSLTPQDRKLFLYSAHEYNIANILTALDIYNDIIPNYGSHIIIELRKINGVYGFKVLLQNYEGNGELQLLKLPKCDYFCPLDRFVQIVQDIIPEDESACNV
ncbi:venom acid phosphatase Acph-1 [Agrilus planipennis]|uniref:acid phosphatase n=1 Tax=Agrilus planipennis TaxID=224129 RepID=A0A1W4WUK6_AGRPL|nr:venom acid phosphatase Acph-1 [Agrilus planipennis]